MKVEYHAHNIFFQWMVEMIWFNELRYCGLSWHYILKYKYEIFFATEFHFSDILEICLHFSLQVLHEKCADSKLVGMVTIPSPGKAEVIPVHIQPNMMRKLHTYFQM